MDIETLLQRARVLNLALWPDGDKIRYRATGGQAVANLLQEIAADRGAVLDVLRRQARFPLEAYLKAGDYRPRSIVAPHYVQAMMAYRRKGMIPRSSMFGIRLLLKAGGNFDFGAFIEAARRLYDRSPILAATMERNSEGKFEFVFPSSIDVIIARSFIELPASDGEMALSLSEALLDTALGEDGDPLCRIFAIKQAGEGGILGIALHSFITDPVARDLLIHCVFQTYECIRDGRPLPEHSASQYATYIEALEAWLAAPGGIAQIEAWKEAMLRAPQTHLPHDCSPATGSACSVDEICFDLDGLTPAMLRSRAAAFSVTPFILLLTANALALAAAIGRNDVTVQILHNGRTSLTAS